MSSNIIGPVLPPGFASSAKDKEEESGEEEIEAVEKLTSTCSADIYGPALPPGFSNQTATTTTRVIGPSLPPGFSNLYQSSEDDEDDDFIGPMPSTSSDDAVASDVSALIDRRAQKMKDKLAGKDEKVEGREEWMTELPPELGKQFGLGPRTFRRTQTTTGGDRSGWTEIQGKEKKEPPKKDDGSHWENIVQKSYDTEMKKKSEEFNKSQKRKESLMDLHKKSLKRKKEKEANTPKERRPFDRDQDLKVNLMDEARKEELLKRSRVLNSRFSHGKAQFL